MTESSAGERRYRPPSAAQYAHAHALRYPAPPVVPGPQPTHSRPRPRQAPAVSPGCLLVAAGGVCLLSLVVAGAAVGWALARPPAPVFHPHGGNRGVWGGHWVAAHAADRDTPRLPPRSQRAVTEQPPPPPPPPPPRPTPTPVPTTVSDACLPTLSIEGGVKLPPRVLAEGVAVGDSRLASVPQYLRGKLLWELDPQSKYKLHCPCGLVPRCAAYVMAVHCAPRSLWRPPLWATRRCAPVYHSGGKEFKMTLRRHTWDAHSSYELHMEEPLLREHDSKSLRWLGVVMDTHPACDGSEAKCNAEPMCRWVSSPHPECRTWECEGSDDDPSDVVPSCDLSGTDAAARIRALEREVEVLRASSAERKPKRAVQPRLLLGGEDPQGGRSFAQSLLRLKDAFLAGWTMARYQEAAKHFNKSVASRCDLWAKGNLKHTHLVVAHTSSAASGAFEQALRLAFKGDSGSVRSGPVRYGDLEPPWAVEGREGSKHADLCAVLPPTDDDSLAVPGTLSGLADAAALYTRANRTHMTAMRRLCDRAVGEEATRLCADVWHVLVERAKAVLAKRFAVVGVSERVEDTIAVARCRLPWLRESGEGLPPIAEQPVHELPGASAALRDAARSLRGLHTAAAAILSADVECCARLAAADKNSAKRPLGDKNAAGVATDKNR
eukprot:TRINITY_DN1840_c3_g4_i1.p1 TRINITY_DN1840_c3_g4~~TRINITY_DN1840_c3_g4_i1.p1  ORF type:complete len:665 (+),score=134.68 TRINITY_DN1840_c3_g4_i1:53-2047(+)